MLRAKGFTLIELVVAIVVLGLLAVVVAPRFLNVQDDARSSVIAGYAASFTTALETIAAKHKIEGEPDFIEVEGTVIMFARIDPNTIPRTHEKYSYPYPNTSIGCVELWNAGVQGTSAVLTSPSEGELLVEWDSNTTTCSFTDTDLGTLSYKSGAGEVLVSY